MDPKLVRHLTHLRGKVVLLVLREEKGIMDDMLLTLTVLRK